MLGLWIVTCGVLSSGVPAPNAAIDEGTNTFAFNSLATSKVFTTPSTLTFQVNCGMLSPLAESIAAKFTIVSALNSFANSNILFGSVTSNISKRISSTAALFASEQSVAKMFSLP